MSSCREGLIALALTVLTGLAAVPTRAAAEAYPGIGRPATASEVAAWDIDVRPDFKGLPKGSGSVAQGMAIWEGKCASCHGIFGESNQVFSPLVGGTTKEDVQAGRVARLLDPSFPGRTTLMKVATVSTLWDYISRAMPWNQPKSLSADEVYAVTAYLLNLGGLLADDFVMSDANIAQVQSRMPNRQGMTTEHAMWPGKTMGQAKPDVQAVACMKDCPTGTLSSQLPDFARDAHGNLSQQQRIVGAQLGADTTQPPGARPVPQAAPAATSAGAGAPTALLAQYSCVACHGMDNKIVGPGFAEIAKRYADRADRVDHLAGKIVAGGAGTWGDIPMPAQSLPAEDARRIAQWLAQGAKK